MRVAEIITSSSTSITEGTWSLPDTFDKVREIMDMLQDPISPSDKKKMDRIYDLLGSDNLLDDIGRARQAGEQDVRPVIIKNLPDFLDTSTWFTKPDEHTQFAINMLKKKYRIR